MRGSNEESLSAEISARGADWGVARRSWMCALLFAIGLPVASASFGQLTLKIGDTEQTLVTLGNRVVAADLISAPESSSRKGDGVVLFETRAYRDVSLTWEKGTGVSARLFGEMGDGTRVLDCGGVDLDDSGWRLDPESLICDGEFVDKASLIEFTVLDANGNPKYLYLRLFNRRLPFAGSDLGVVLTLVEPLDRQEGAQSGFEANNGLSVYYSVSKLKSERWRGIVNIAALDQVKDDRDLEVGIGLGVLFKSNGFMDSNAGLSLAAGIGYNLMIPSEPERWYWFVGLGTNFDISPKE